MIFHLVLAFKIKSLPHTLFFFFLYPTYKARTIDARVEMVDETENGDETKDDLVFAQDSVEEKIENTLDILFSRGHEQANINGVERNYPELLLHSSAGSTKYYNDLQYSNHSTSQLIKWKNTKVYQILRVIIRNWEASGRSDTMDTGKQKIETFKDATTKKLFRWSSEEEDVKNRRKQMQSKSGGPSKDESPKIKEELTFDVENENRLTRMNFQFSKEPFNFNAEKLLGEEANRFINRRIHFLRQQHDRLIIQKKVENRSREQEESLKKKKAINDRKKLRTPGEKRKGLFESIFNFPHVFAPKKTSKSPPANFVESQRATESPTLVKQGKKMEKQANESDRESSPENKPTEDITKHKLPLAKETINPEPLEKDGRKNTLPYEEKKNVAEISGNTHRNSDEHSRTSDFQERESENNSQNATDQNEHANKNDVDDLLSL